MVELYYERYAMLSKKEARNKVHQFYNGIKNCGWFSGFIFRLSDDRKTFYIRQSEYTAHLFKVELGDSEWLSQDFSEGSGIKIYTRLHSEMIREHNSIILCPLMIEHPSMLELPRLDEYAKQNNNNKDQFNPYDVFGLEMPAGSALNKLYIGGFLESLRHDKNSKGEIKPDCLLLELRIEQNKTLPVRIYGNRCRVIYQHIKKLANRGYMYPLYFDSELRTKLIEDHGEQILATYIHSDRINVLDPTNLHKYFIGKPDWIDDFVSRYQESVS